MAHEPSAHHADPESDELSIRIRPAPMAAEAFSSGPVRSTGTLCSTNLTSRGATCVLTEISIAACSAIPPPVSTVMLICLGDRKSTRLNSSHVKISYAVFCLKKKKRHYILTALETTGYE